jgi:NCAIR mutase (PurE)-related protein
MPDGSPVKGEGKFKKELVELGVLMSDVVEGSLGGELVMVQNEPVVEVPAEVVAEVVAEVPEVPVSKTYTVVASIMGFKVSREFNVKIDELTNTLYLE